MVVGVLPAADEGVADLLRPPGGGVAGVDGVAAWLLLSFNDSIMLMACASWSWRDLTVGSCKHLQVTHVSHTSMG